MASSTRPKRANVESRIAAKTARSLEALQGAYVDVHNMIVSYLMESVEELQRIEKTAVLNFPLDRFFLTIMTQSLASHLNKAKRYTIEGMMELIGCFHSHVLELSPGSSEGDIAWEGAGTARTVGERSDSSELFFDDLGAGADSDLRSESLEYSHGGRSDLSDPAHYELL